MTAPPPGLGLLRVALALTAVGVLSSLALLVGETPYRLALFMFVGQPLLAAGFVLLLVRVLRDLKRTGLL